VRNIKVTEVMVPVEEYATVHQDANVYEAVLALEQAQKRFNQERYKHRALLVYDDHKKIAGKLSQLDLLKGLEPKYEKVVDMSALTRFGLGREYMKSMMEKVELWQRPLEDICKKAVEIKVKDIMYTPQEEDCVDADSTLDQATHRLIVGRHQSLLVVRDGEIVGVLRLTDVFQKVCEMVKTCQI